MNRKLITLAVAAALAAPTAAMAEAVLYGKLNVSIDYVDVDANAYWPSVFPGTGGVPRNGGAPNFASAMTGSPINNNGDFLQARNPATGALLFAADGTPIPSGSPFRDFPGFQSLVFGTSNNLFTDGQLIPGRGGAFVGQQTSAPVTYAPGTIVESVTYNPVSKQLQTTNFTVAAPNTVNVFNLVFANVQETLLANGYSPDAAGAVAFNTALGEAWRLATDEQRSVAAQQGLIASRGQSFKGWGLDMNGRASRIGVKGSEDLGNGLKAIYQIELGVDIANDNRDTNLLNGNRTNGFSFRNTFVGLAGNWGSVLVGRHDTPLKLSTGKLDLFADTLADMNYTIGFQDLRADSVIAYISPSFSGFTFSAAIVPAGGATGISQFNNNSDSLAGAYSLAGIYSNGPFYVSLAYENLGSDMFTESNPWSNLGLYQGTQDTFAQAMFGSGLEDDTKWRVGLGLLDWNGFTLSGIYEQHSNVNGAPKNADMDLWQIQAAYAFGNSQVKAMYGQADVDGCVAPFTFTCTTGIPGLQNQDKSAWAIGFDHNFSKRTKVYALYTAMDDDSPDADWSGFSLGMVHSF